VKKLFLVAISLVLLNPAQLYAGDREDLIKQIEQNWVNYSNKTVDMSSTHPDGTWQATSQGGLWALQSPEEAKSQIEDSPNTLNFRPHHIEVTIVGKNKDVAYTNYYAVGKITGPDGKVIAENYRTRFSGTLVKKGGKWLFVGRHASPLYGGSGVILD
jgi:hypothetical protein